MRFSEYVKAHPWRLAIGTAIGVVGSVVGYFQLPEGIVSVSKALWWALSTETGKAICTGVSLAIILWFWVVYPLLVSRSRRTTIAELCARLDALSDQCGTTISGADIHIATSAGSVVKKLRDNGAYRDDPVLEELIEVAMRRQLLVQLSREHPNGPASQGEYQAFWVARESACKRIGQTGPVVPGPESIKSGCAYVADDARRRNQIPVSAR